MRLPVAAFVFLLSTFALGASTPDIRSASYQADYAKWRNELEDSRRQNWVPLVGLFWLHDGENRVGSDQRDDVPLPAGKAPAQVGVILFHAGKATFTAVSSASVSTDGKQVQTTELQSDVNGQPTVLQVGDLHLHLIERGKRFGIRVKDTASAGDFHPSEFYPLTGNFMVEAAFIPYDKPRQVAIPTVLGQDAMMESPGEVEFTLNGQKIRLQAVTEGSPELMLIVKDQTSGKTTYPAGRFIDTAAPKDGKVIIDFNRAYSPPCAFTAYATCPMPPRQNWLPIPVEAGEKYSGHH